MRDWPVGLRVITILTAGREFNSCPRQIMFFFNTVRKIYYVTEDFKNIYEIDTNTPRLRTTFLCRHKTHNARGDDMN